MMKYIPGIAIEKKLIVSFIVLVLLLIVAHLMPIRPVVTIVNKTNEPLYIYPGESIYGVEPDDKEAVRIVKSKPETVVHPGKEFKLTASFMSLIRKDAEIDIGWRIGSKYGYNSTGSGGQHFLLSSTAGVCSASVEVQSGYHNRVLKNNPGNFCLKKIDAFSYQY